MRTTAAIDNLQEKENKMTKDKRVVIRFEDTKYNEIKLAAGDDGAAEYIRQGADLKLLDGKSSRNELSNIAKKVEALNTKPTEQKVADIEIKLQIIYEELQRQNEILKLIHRRSTFAANFSLHGLDELKKSTNFSEKEQQELIDITGDEIKKSGIQFLRK